jgi:hypothetical protein
VSNDREILLFVPPDCEVGEAQARAIIESSRAAAELDLGAYKITVRASDLVQPGTVIVANPSVFKDVELLPSDPIEPRWAGYSKELFW